MDNFGQSSPDSDYKYYPIFRLRVCSGAAPRYIDWITSDAGAASAAKSRGFENIKPISGERERPASAILVSSHTLVRSPRNMEAWRMALLHLYLLKWRIVWFLGDNSLGRNSLFAFLTDIPIGASNAAHIAASTLRNTGIPSGAPDGSHIGPPGIALY